MRFHWMPSGFFDANPALDMPVQGKALLRVKRQIQSPAKYGCSGRCLGIMLQFFGNHHHHSGEVGADDVGHDGRIDTRRFSTP
jgi:hypothetical protein